MKKNKDSVIKFIDLFAGLGGIRLGLELALKDLNIEGKCVFTSEIKNHAIKVYKENFIGEEVYGDITKILPKEIPDFDILLAGFPCQPFSSAGSRKGFLDTRGTLFFNIQEILREKKPKAFLLENVEGLVTHDRVDKNNKIGRTLETILKSLNELGYNVTWKLIDSSNHGIPQKRKRIYIVGSLNKTIDIDNLEINHMTLSSILEKEVGDEHVIKSELAQKLLSTYDPNNLSGKQVKDKRGGKNNIHSWDISLKGEVSDQQKFLLELLISQRRRKEWAQVKNIKWSDGIPLTLEDISKFYYQIFDKSETDYLELEQMLKDLVKKGYLKYETPKNARDRTDLAGYNIVTGKLSFDISNILDHNKPTPTLVAMDATKMALIDKNKLRRLTIREGLRLFGFPDSYKMENVKYKEAFDLLGNSVSVNVIKLISNRIINQCFEN
jgi:DNA (cytosine-5)-methyltransferase 1